MKFIAKYVSLGTFLVCALSLYDARAEKGISDEENKENAVFEDIPDDVHPGIATFFELKELLSFRQTSKKFDTMFKYMVPKTIKGKEYKWLLKKIEEYEQEGDKKEVANYFRVLKTLDVAGTNITAEDLNKIGTYCSKIVVMNLDDCQKIDFTKVDIKLENLNVLNVSNTNIKAEGFNKTTKFCPRIVMLKFNHCNFIDFTNVNLNFKNLTNLDLSYTNVEGSGISKICESCPRIVELSLRSCNLVHLTGVDLNFKDLKVLNLSYTNITEKDVNKINTFCPNIIKLNLNACGNVDFAKVDLNLKDLKILKVMYTSIKPEHIKKIRKNCPALESLKFKFEEEKDQSIGLVEVVVDQNEEGQTFLSVGAEGMARLWNSSGGAWDRLRISSEPEQFNPGDDEKENKK